MTTSTFSSSLRRRILENGVCSVAPQTPSPEQESRARKLRRSTHKLLRASQLAYSVDVYPELPRGNQTYPSH